MTGVPVWSAMTSDAVSGVVHVWRIRRESAPVAWRDTPAQENGTRIESAASVSPMISAAGWSAESSRPGWMP